MLTKIQIKPRHIQILRMIRQYWVRLFFAMCCMLAIAFAASATAFLVKPVLDDIFFKQDKFMLTLIPPVIVVIYLLRGAGYYGQEYLMNYVGERIVMEIRNMLYNRIQELSVAFFQEEKTGGLMSRITNDVNIVKGMVSTCVTSILRDMFTIAGLIGVIFYRDWKMASIAILILPLAFYPVFIFGKKVRRVSTSCQQTMAELTAFLHETLLGNKIVKAFGMEEHEKERFAEKTRDLFCKEMKNVRAKSIQSPVMEGLAGIGIAFIIWFGGYKVISGESTPGTFFSFMTAVIMLYDPVKKISKLNNAIQQGMAAADRVFDVIEKESDIPEIADPVEFEDGTHRIAFENVGLSYNGVPALRNIDLEIEPGEVVALVGKSGSGKTSLANLIPRFYDVTEGRILINGVDIRHASIKSLRKQIGIVSQDTILFNETIRANIAYGKKDVSQEELEAAAKASFAYDFVKDLSDGFDSNIGELGGKLSGGEKQRICIARALMKDAPILILDEATSSLDSESEMVVQKALENLMKGRTTLVIAHRLSTIAHADRIVVLSKGRIVEAGDHKSLMAKDGAYRRLYTTQYQQGAGGEKAVVADSSEPSDTLPIL